MFCGFGKKCKKFLKGQQRLDYTSIIIEVWKTEAKARGLVHICTRIRKWTKKQDFAVCTVHQSLLCLFCYCMFRVKTNNGTKKKVLKKAIFVCRTENTGRINEIMLCGLCCPSVPLVVVLSMRVHVLGFLSQFHILNIKLPSVPKTSFPFLHAYPRPNLIFSRCFHVGLSRL